MLETLLPLPPATAAALLVRLRHLGGPGSGWSAEAGHVPGSQGGSYAQTQALARVPAGLTMDSPYGGGKHAPDFDAQAAVDAGTTKVTLKPRDFPSLHGTQSDTGTAAVREFIKSYPNWDNSHPVVLVEHNGTRYIHDGHTRLIAARLMGVSVPAEIASTKSLKGLGGPGSGNFGHAGRPGERGGSGSDDTDAAKARPEPQQHEAKRVHELHKQGVSATGIATRMGWGGVSGSRGKIALDILARYDEEGNLRAGAPAAKPAPERKAPEPEPEVSQRYGMQKFPSDPDWDHTNAHERLGAQKAVQDMHRVMGTFDVPVELGSVAFVTGTHAKGSNTMGYYRSGGFFTHKSEIVLGTGSQVRPEILTNGGHAYNAGQGVDFVARHELGHAVQASLPHQPRTEWEREFGKASYISRKDRSQTIKGRTEAALISQYAATKSVEHFAEAFAVYTHRDYGQPHVRPLPPATHAYMTKWFPKKKR